VTLCLKEGSISFPLNVGKTYGAKGLDVKKGQSTGEIAKQGQTEKHGKTAWSR